MSMHALRWAFRLSLTGPRKSVLVSLADHCGDTFTCWPSARRLALWSGCSERSVRDALHQLAAQGLVAITSRDGRVSKYRLLVPEVLPVAEPDEDDLQPLHHPPQPLHDSPPPRQQAPEPLREVPTNPHEDPREPPIETPARGPAPAAKQFRKVILVDAKSSAAQLSLVPADKARKSGLSNGRLAAFEKFWEMYPHRTQHDGSDVKLNKWAAEQEFARALRKVGGDPGVILEALRNFRFPPSKYIKDPDRWLREGNIVASVKPQNPDDANPFAALHRMQAEHARAGADDFAGTTIDAELEEYPHG